MALGGLIALALANVIGSSITAVKFRDELNGPPKWWVAFLGCLGIMAIAKGLRGSHTELPVSMSMEAVYGSLAFLSWFLFVWLRKVSPNSFGERPNGFDLKCHCLMASLVILRFALSDITFSNSSWLNIGLAVLGYLAFNVSIKLARGHRPTTIAMNLGGGLLLGIMAIMTNDIPETISLQLLLGTVIGGVAIFGIVKSLGSAYTYFGKLGMSSLVITFVYDGILVVSQAIDWYNNQAVSYESLAMAIGMLLIAIVRYRHHMVKK